MTNPIALTLGAIILVALTLDQFLNDGMALLFLGQKLTDLTTMKWKVREILQRLCLFQITSEEFSPYYIAISEGSNDDLVRLLFSELDRGDMANFNMRIVPKHVTSEK